MSVFKKIKKWLNPSEIVREPCEHAWHDERLGQAYLRTCVRCGLRQRCSIPFERLGR
jgi:hypothetical protein